MDTRAHALEGNRSGGVAARPRIPEPPPLRRLHRPHRRPVRLRGCRGLDVPARGEARLSPGDEVAIGRYRVEYRGGDIEQGPNYVATVANLTVSEEGGRPIGSRPERRFYPGQEQTTSEVAIWSRTFEDFYAILETFDPATGIADITLIVNPMLMWIWIGAE